MPTVLQARFGCALNPTYVDSACHDVIYGLTSLPPATVIKNLPDIVEYKMLGVHVDRPRPAFDSQYYFSVDASGVVAPRIETLQGRPTIYKLRPALDHFRFDRVTIQQKQIFYQHFLLRPCPPELDGTFPFQECYAYTKRETVGLIYRDKNYRVEFRQAWRFPSRDESWDLYFTRPVCECYIETQDDDTSMEDLMDVVSMCTPPVFGDYLQDFLD